MFQPYFDKAIVGIGSNLAQNLAITHEFHIA
jgi:hypothetical protein